MAKSQIFKLFLLIYFLSGIYVFFFSESGLLERDRLKGHYSRLVSRIELLTAETSRLGKQLDQFRKGNFSAFDLIDSGYIRHGESALYVPENSPAEKGAGHFLETSTGVPLVHVRVMWLFFSGIVILFFISRNIKKSEI